MNEQIGLAVAHERRWTQQQFTQRVKERMEQGKIRGDLESVQYFAMETVAAEMVEDYEAALAEQRTEDPAKEWADLAALHDAEIKRLRAENADLTVRLEKMAAFLTVTEEELDARQARHDTQIADLAAKLATANAELTDLRIKAGIGQPEPVGDPDGVDYMHWIREQPWPEGATCVTLDKQGGCCWWNRMPLLRTRLELGWQGDLVERYYDPSILFVGVKWQRSQVQKAFFDT